MKYKLSNQILSMLQYREFRRLVFSLRGSCMSSVVIVLMDNSLWMDGVLLSSWNLRRTHRDRRRLRKARGANLNTPTRTAQLKEVA